MSYIKVAPEGSQASASIPGGQQGRVPTLLPRTKTSLPANQYHELETRRPSDPFLPRRKRASKPKVRSGCITCKIRRVKCDERKPNCARCEKADMECDGYVKEAVDPKKIAQREWMILAAQKANRHLLPRPTAEGFTLVTSDVAPQLCQNPSLLRIDRDDVSYYDIFRNRLICDLSGVVHSDFWSRIVLNESMRDPCVQESILAIGAISQALFTSKFSNGSGGASSALHPWGSQNPHFTSYLDHNHKAALTHHIKALSIYRERIARTNTTVSPRSVIIMTLLLAAFEFIQGNMRNVDSLMGTGMHVLENNIAPMQCQTGEPVPYCETESLPSRQVRDDEMNDIEHLLPCLSLMSGFTHFFNLRRASFSMMSSSPTLELPEPGVTAMAKLQKLWSRFFSQAVVYTMRVLHEQVNFKDRNISAATAEQGTFIAYISMWESILDAYLEDPALSDRARRTLEMIQIHRLMIYIVISCSVDRHEMLYDNFEPQLRELLDRVIRYAQASKHISLICFTYAESLTSPLSTIVAKCRNHDLRMRAMHLLNTISWRDGAWDGRALVVGQSGVVLLEERGRDENGFIPPESRWVWMSGKWDLERRKLLATYCRMTPDKDGNPVHVQLDLDMDILTDTCGMMGCSGHHDPFEHYES